MGTVFLIIMLFIEGMPVFDFMVFQSMKECLKAKKEVTAALKENEMPTPLYFECKSAPSPKESAQN